MKRSFCLGVFLVALVSLTASAGATTADFQGNCTWSGLSLYCNFDGQRPTSSPSGCDGGASPRYTWDFGDGSGAGPSYSSTTSHTYAYPPAGQNGYYVDLTVNCTSDIPHFDDKERYICINAFGFPGCIFQDGTWY